ncbi:hypothetical protein QOZ80_8BG0659830 [Eleusine coracana subsp. coracana]|nr:hypothetical protein QOZ80_8BG0659830 [Eleusine coracana subsp. coracana]
MSQPVMAAAYPPWVMFEHYCTEEVSGSSIGDTKTLAAVRTTTDLDISVSLSLAPPPEGSRVCVQLPLGFKASYSLVLAAHDDSMVIQVTGIRGRAISSFDSGTTEHFIYNAGAAAADPPRPPSLLLLPPYGRANGKTSTRRYMNTDSTGLLRCGMDEFVVAELCMVEVEEGNNKQNRTAAELVLLRSNSSEWSVTRPSIRHWNDDGNGQGKI